jgi:hypothetical protein
LFPRTDAGDELLEELSSASAVEEATLATLGEPPPPQPTTTRARDTDCGPGDPAWYPLQHALGIDTFGANLFVATHDAPDVC